MINVFVIDDHPAIISRVEFMLSDEEDGVKFVGSAKNISVPSRFPGGIPGSGKILTILDYSRPVILD